MAQFPALPLWTDAYIADTQHLTNEEHGVYLRLLMFAWRTPDCSLPDDDRRLALMVGVTPKKWASLKTAVMVFWSLEDGRWMQKRLTAEREFVERNRKQKSAAGVASSEAKALKKKETASTAVAEPWVTATSTERQQPIPIPINKNILSETGSDNAPEKKGKISYPEAFESFWNVYPRSANMAKKEAFDAWKKLTAEEREQCLRAIPGYIAFLKTKPTLETIHACRFISKRRFEGFASAAGEAPAVVDDEKWLKRLRYGRREGAWSSASWGPCPGQPGSLVPLALLESGDGEGWSEMEVAA